MIKELLLTTKLADGSSFELHKEYEDGVNCSGYSVWRVYEHHLEEIAKSMVLEKAATKFTTAVFKALGLII